MTLRARDHVWNLRSHRSYRAIAAALRGMLGRDDFRVVHFSVQGNHLHLIVESEGAPALAAAMKGLAVRLARGLNRLMGRSGPAFTDRYHSHLLETPREVANALRYVLGNFVSHATRRGEQIGGGFVDPYSSRAAVAPDGLPAAVRPRQTWLLARAERAFLAERARASSDVRDGVRRAPAGPQGR